MKRYNSLPPQAIDQEIYLRSEVDFYLYNSLDVSYWECIT